MNLGPCPRCDVALRRVATAGGAVLQCPRCDGQALTASLLQKELKPNLINQLLRAAKPQSPGFEMESTDDDTAGVGSSGFAMPAATLAKTASDAACPTCEQVMALIDVPLERSGAPLQLDVCRPCQLLWFDAGEYKLIPKRYEEHVTTPRVGALHCDHCGAPARPDLNSYCRYCQQALAPARTPGATVSTIPLRSPARVAEDSEANKTPLLDVLSGVGALLKLLR